MHFIATATAVCQSHVGREVGTYKSNMESLANMTVNLNKYKPLWPWIATLIFCVAIECTYLIVANPHPADRTNFLQFEFANADTVQRLMAFEKLRNLATSQAQIIQVGDSSGLHGVQPDVVSARLGGVSYANLGVATNLGYLGYYNVAKYALERNTKAKILVLYTTMLIAPPRGELWKHGNKLLGESIQREFVDPFHRFFQTPTLAARRSVTDGLYYLNGAFKTHDAPLSTNYGYLTFHDIYMQSRGWTRETDVAGDGVKDIWQPVYDVLEGRLPQNIPPDILRIFRSGFGGGETEFFDWRRLSYTSYMEEIYGSFADLARQHGVVLVIIHNPLPEGVRNPRLGSVFRVSSLEGKLHAYQATHPDVVVQTTFDYWPDAKFSVFSHVGTAYARENSNRVADFLRPVLARMDIEPTFEQFQAPVATVIDFAKVFSGYRWGELDNHGRRRPITGASQALVFSKLSPGASYQMRVYVSPETTKTCTGHVLATVNGNLIETLSVSNQEHPYLNWRVPKEIVSADNGWAQIMFSLDGSSVWHGRLDANQNLSCRHFDVNKIVLEPEQDSPQ